MAEEGDAVVTDVVLPDESGFDLLPRLKKARPLLPVLVMSAKNTMMTAITAAERGAYEYLPKPFDLNDLIRLTGRAIEDSRRQRAGHGRRRARWRATICRSSAARRRCRRSTGSSGG